jgi:hypothetical protein
MGTRKRRVFTAEQKAIERFLAALDLPGEHPEIERARPPPQLELSWGEGGEALEDQGIDAMGEGA